MRRKDAGTATGRKNYGFVAIRTGIKISSFHPCQQSSVNHSSRDFNFSADVWCMRIHHLDGHNPKSLTNHRYLSLRALQGGSTASSCASRPLWGVSLIVHSGIRFCGWFIKQLEKLQAKDLIWNIRSVQGNKCPTIRGCQSLSLM